MIGSLADDATNLAEPCRLAPDHVDRLAQVADRCASVPALAPVVRMLHGEVVAGVLRSPLLRLWFRDALSVLRRLVVSLERAALRAFLRLIVSLERAALVRDFLARLAPPRREAESRLEEHGARSHRANGPPATTIFVQAASA
jgi:hypothetical protein